MKRFFYKLFITASPIIIIFGLISTVYFCLDPFRVLYSYENYYEHAIAGLNRDYVSSEMFLKNYSKYHYDSFIFGSSRAGVGYSHATWKKYLPKNANNFAFDASSESIYGIYTKLKYIDDHQIPIKNALIIICRDHTFNRDADHKGLLLFMKHPTIIGESKLEFQKTCFSRYWHIHFLHCFFDYILTKKYKPYMGNYIPKEENTTYNPISNEWKLIERTISPHTFYERPASERVYSIRQINEKQQFMLKEIRRILEKNHTNYKVVISPLYEQTKFNPADLSVLQACFGENLYDFSGKNSFTDNTDNFFETSHYRPCGRDSILRIIYTQKLAQALDSLEILP